MISIGAILAIEGLPTEPVATKSGLAAWYLNVAQVPIPAAIMTAATKDRVILRIVTSASKMISLRRDSVSDCLSFDVERRAEFVVTTSWSKSARRTPYAIDKGVAGHEKPLVGKGLFALGPGAIERSISPGS
jgi:hypothetical protein